MSAPILFQHQEKAITDAEIYPNRLIFRLPGTGKTRIGLEIVHNQLKINRSSRILWISPANLIPQLDKQLDKFTVPHFELFPDKKILEGQCAICSYDMLRLQQGFICDHSWDLVICDEIHKAKSIDSQTNHALWNLRKKASHWYGFTGTPFQNTPYEFFELVSLCAGRDLRLKCEMCLQYKHPKITPIRNFLRKIGLHLARSNQGPIIGIRNAVQLSSIIGSVIDYVPPDQYTQECNLPDVSTTTVPVPLSEAEEKTYRSILHKFNRKKRYRLFMDDDVNEEQIDSCFQGMSMLRTVAFQDSKPVKLIKILQEIKHENANAKILVFCNFVERGLNVCAKFLVKGNIPHVLYNGTVTALKRDDLIKNYLCGKENILLISPVGFEGLDLYGTTHIIILDPHYNPERTKQLMSRAIRAFSNVKKIKIIKFQSVSKNPGFPLIDEIIERIANRKAKIADMLEGILRDYALAHVTPEGPCSAAADGEKLRKNSAF